jgi:ankyrin repeat protein
MFYRKLITSMKLHYYPLLAWTLFAQASNLHATQVHVQTERRIEHSLNHILLAATKSNDLIALQELFSGETIPYIEAKNKGNCTALLIAAAHGYFDIVALLVAAGADTQAQELFDNTPLILAARNGHRMVVTQLSAQGADLNAKNFNGFTALMLAAQNDHMDIVQLLVAQGADCTQCNAKDSNKVARDYAADKAAYENAVSAGFERQQLEAQYVAQAQQQLISCLDEVITEFVYSLSPANFSEKQL